jgi:hypothetical protein
MEARQMVHGRAGLPQQRRGQQRSEPLRVLQSLDCRFAVNHENDLSTISAD